jgi:transcriptional regulator with XRE-family HTH domain
MGRSTRARPKRLGAKLRQIRTSLGLTQPEMIKALGVKGARLHPSNISEFESNRREPSLLVLLAYSNLSGHTINDLVDDKVKLTEHS